MASLFRQRGSLLVAMLSFVVLTSPGVDQAQETSITSTTGAGNLGTTITHTGNLYDITGGTRPGSGPNLFHSFGDFTVGSGDIANFLNNTGLQTSNIIGRVTGGHVSDIYGTIQTNGTGGFGTANLYLINPAGIIFRPTAELNVGGSVNISTADYLTMTDGAKFYADPAQSTVLSMAPVEAFGFLASRPASITIDGSTLQVPTANQCCFGFGDPPNHISLIGGNLTIVGGTLRAPDGEISLASVASSGEVIPDTNIPGERDFTDQDFDTSSFSQLGQIHLSQALLDIGANGASQRESTGGVLIKADQLKMDASGILAQNPAGRLGAGIDIQVNSIIANGSNFSVNNAGGGEAGAIHIQGPAGNITPATGITLNQSSLTAESAFGSAGIITLVGSSINLTDSTFSTSSGGGDSSFQAGPINLLGQNISITGGILSTSTNGAARAGEIFIATNNIVLSNGATLSSTSTGTACLPFCGSAGEIFISTGANGSITPLPESISLIGSSILTDANDAPAGEIQLAASKGITLIDSTISSRVTGTPAFPTPANIVLTAPNVTMTGGTISASTLGVAPAGGITLHVDTLTASSSTISSTSSVDTRSPRDPEAGKAGDITIQGIGSGNSATHVSLDESQISTDNFGGNANNTASSITITAHTLALANYAQIRAGTGGEAPGGDITLNVDTLTTANPTGDPTKNTLILSGSFSTDSTAGKAGNITIQGLTGPGSSATRVSLDGGASFPPDPETCCSFISTKIAGGNINTLRGAITITAKTLDLANFAHIEADTGGAAPAGDILLNVDALTASSSTISSLSGVISGTPLDSAGNAGSITIQGIISPGSPATPATSVSLDESAIRTDIVGGSANTIPSAITITAKTVDLANLVQIRANTAGKAPAGDITFNVDTLSAANSTGNPNPLTISSSSGFQESTAGNAGTITIQGITSPGSPATPATSVSFKGNTLINTEIDGGSADTSRGTITITAKTVDLDTATIRASTIGAAPAGDITFNVDTLSTEDRTFITSSSPLFTDLEDPPTGNAGRITIQGISGSGSPAANVRLDLSNLHTTISGGSSSTTPAAIDITAQTMNLRTASISADTLGEAPAGAITLTATESIALTRTSSVSSSSFGAGNAGGVSLTAPTITLTESSRILSTTGSTGNAGSILIDGTMVGVTNGAAINSSTFGAGNAGTVTIRAKEAVTVKGSAPDTGFVSTVASATVLGAGTAGKVTIEAPSIEVSDRGTVFTSNNIFGGRAGDIILDGRQVTIAGGGQVTSGTESPAPGGTVTIEATDFLTISGSDSQGNASRVATATLGDGDAGQIVINTPTFTMNGGEILAFSGNIDPFTGQPLPNSGDAGSIDIGVHNASLTGGAQVQASSIDKGQGGRVTISASDSLLIAGADADGFSTTISSSSVTGNAGEITLSAPTMTITDGAFVTAFSDGAGKAGAVTLKADWMNITGGASVDSSTFGTGQGGSVTITAAEQMRLAGRNDEGPSQITTITAGSGTAGQILVTTPILELQEGAIFANTGAAGNAGSIVVEAGQLSLTNDALIASRSVQNATGDAGSVDLQVTGLFSSQASAVSTEALQGTGGNVSITAGNINLNSGTTISAESAGSEDAGSIALTSATDILMRNSTVTTFAANASGGDITLIAPHIIRLVDSKLISSVQGQAGSSDGGNITIDPQFVILSNRSQILAQAFGGDGGNIKITTNTFLAEPGTQIDATSQTGISGTVNINAPIQVLSGTLVPLNLVYSQAGLSGDRCAADPKGQFSSFVQTGRDVVPQVPGALTPSPLSFLEPVTSGSLRSPWPNWAAVRLGLDSVNLDDSTLFRFHSACRS